MLLAQLGTGMAMAQQGAATGEPIVFATAPLPKGFLRQPYHFKLEAQGGITPLRWEVTNGALPEGVELAPDGTLSGAPTEADSFVFVVTVSDSGKPVAQKKKEYTVEVVAPLVVEWSKKPKITGHRLDAAMHSKFREDIAHMAFDGIDRERKRFGNLLI